MGIKIWIENWKRKRAERAAEQKRLDDLFEKFLAETEPLTPKASKHPQVALFRHAWKRAIVFKFPVRQTFRFGKVRVTQKVA